VAATSLNHPLKGSQSTPAAQNSQAKKHTHWTGRYCHLAEFSAAKCKKYEIKEQIFIIVSL
jgi:hypothetical protein